MTVVATILTSGAAPGRPPSGTAGCARAQILGLYACIVALHGLGWGLYLHYAAAHPSIVGLGFVAYLFGLRHAFDADHIAAIDDTVRLMIQKGRAPLGVGFFFSLGHSTIVMGVVVAISVAATGAKHVMPQLRSLGEIFGAGTSGTFLCIVGLLNLRVLLDIVQVWRIARDGSHAHTHLDEILQRRGFLNRLLGARFRRVMSRAWQMYPLGLLFGLGFDTASEVGLLAMTAAASAADLPLAALLSLPLLFAAGMTLMDTTDGILMARAYDWAYVNPLRKVFYNVVTTGLSVALALGVGAVELLQVAVRMLGWRGKIADFVVGLNFAVLGYVAVALFAVAWASSTVLWKFGRFQNLYSPTRPSGGLPGESRIFAIKSN